MALPTYNYGSIPTDAEFNAYLRPTFVIDEGGEEFPGQLLRLRDASLSNDATQIKSRWYTFQNELLVTAGSGLSISWTGGKAFLANGTIATISPGSGTVTANATSFVFVNSSGAVAIASALPLNRLPLASVVAGASAITSVSDLRPRFEVQPRGNIIKLFGGGGDEGAFNQTSGSATLDQSEYYFSSFTLGSAATLTIDKYAYIRVSGDVVIDGTISVNTASPGGIFEAVIAASNQLGFFGGIGPGAPAGSRAGATYSHLLYSTGSGGQTGYVLSPAGNTGSIGTYGGAGGGGLIIEAGGTITINSSGSILARGGVASALVTGGGTAIAISGGGGGSGGLILLKSAGSIICAAGSTLDVRGGNGANGFGTGAGGGGGGGGRIIAIAPTVTTAGANFLLTGGSKGTDAATTVSGGFGGSFGGAGSNNLAATGGTGVYTSRTFIPVG